MTVANASATSGDGSVCATHTIGGKEYIVSLPADNDGHIIGSRPDWMVMSTSVTNALSVEVLQLFNAQAATILRVRGVWIIPTQTTQTTGCSPGYDLNRISTVGSTGSTVETPRPCDTTFAALPAGVTARRGSTAGATLVYKYLTQYNFNDEASANNQIMSMTNLLPIMGDRVAEIVLRTNEGVQVKIGAVNGTAVGNTAALIYFVVDN